MAKSLLALAEKIVKEIHSDVNGRKGIGFDDLDDDIQQEIKSTHEKLVFEVLKKELGE